MTTTDNSSIVTNTTGADDEERPKETVYTIADLGIRANPRTQQTIIGPTRSLSSLSRLEWVYVISSLVSVVVVFGLTVERLIALDSSNPDFTFAFLLSWTTLFCFVYVTQGVLRERAFELLAFVATIVIVFIYVIINYSANSNRSTVKTTRLVITCVFGPILIIGGLYFSRQYFRSKNLIFRTVGANSRMQKMCEIMFAEESLLKFDAQLAGSSVILWLRRGFHLWSTTDKIVVSIGSIVTFSWILLGFLAMRFENKPMIYVFFVTSILEPSIIVWNLTRYLLFGDDDQVLELSVWLTAIIALIVRFVTVVVMALAFINFGKGLKQKVYGSKDNSSEEPNTSEPINA